MEAGLGIIGRIHLSQSTERATSISAGPMISWATPAKDPPLIRSRTCGFALIFHTQLLTAPGRDRDVRRFGSSGNSLPGLFITSDLIAAQALRRRQERGYPRRYRRCLYTSNSSPQKNGGTEAEYASGTLNGSEPPCALSGPHQPSRSSSAPATGFELWMSRVGLACANSRRAYVERLDYVAAAAADSAVSILG